jgi:dinuclear metal center YbgI/SA1388 family protein
MRIKEIIQTIEQLAPLQLQEDFDNSGVQVGDINREATGALLAIDLTEDVIDEAISLGCNLIISHHPIAFKSFKSLTGRNYVERCIMLAIKNDIVIYAAHTNLDNAFGGVNYKLAQMLELKNVKILQPKEDALLKFVTTVPEQHAESVRNAIFNAGAGYIGNYDCCSYNLLGEGTFRAGDSSNPFVGEKGELHYENEVRIEPVFDLFPIINEWGRHGSGVVGELPEPMPEQEFLYMLKDIFNLPTISHSKIQGKDILDIAICGGSGSFLIPKAISYGADVFITGEAKYNDFYDVEDKILLAVVGHYESEICTKEIFYEIISEKFPTFALHKSAFDSNPVKYL